MKNKKQILANRNASELRQDLITGDWVVIATARAKRLDDYKKQREISTTSVEECVFCDPEKSGQEPDVLIYKDHSNRWSLRVFPNKYPAFSKAQSAREWTEGPYFAMNASGYHEIVVTRNHYLDLAQLDPLEVAEVIDAYQDRYLSLMNKKHINYINIFQNHGKEAGASVSHPHSQIIAIPVISPGLKLELNGAQSYWKANKKCVYCIILEWELSHKKRLLFENDSFAVFCPFSSRVAFEVWVVPKKHRPYFERITNEEKIDLGEALGNALRSIHVALDDPAYNYYIHTSPCDGKDYPHYHWHIEILPHTATWAGFELSTGVEISTIRPEDAVEHLKQALYQANSNN